MDALYYSWFVLLLWNFCIISDEAKILQIKEVGTCPKDQSSWEKASRDLNCTSLDRYQCTPNENLTALLEYCYDQPPTLVRKGHCWILSDSHFTNTYSCARFREGCPNTTYRSDELYKFQQCLQVNKLDGCYLVEEKCQSLGKVKTTATNESKEVSSSAKMIIAIIGSAIFIIVLVVATFVVKRSKVCNKNQERSDEEHSLTSVPESSEIHKKEFDLEILLGLYAKCEIGDVVLMDAYIEAFEELCKLFSTLGPVFGIATSEIMEKIVILKEYRRSEVSENYISIQSMIQYEVETKTTNNKKKASGSRSLLRLHRGLEFASKMLSELQNADEHVKLSSLVKSAYDDTIARHHPMYIRRGVHAAIRTLPSIKNIFKKQSHDIEKLKDLFGRVSVAQKRLFDITENLYEKEGLLDLP